MLDFVLTNMKTCLKYIIDCYDCVIDTVNYIYHHQRIGQLKIYEAVSVSSVESAMKYILLPNRMIVNKVMQNLPWMYNWNVRPHM